MFCVECGREEPIFRNGVCIACYMKHTQFTKGPSILDVTICPHCESYKYKNTWVHEPFDDVLKREIKGVFHLSPELKNVQIQTKCNEQERILACMVFFTGVVENQAVTEQHPLTVRLKRVTCDICSREAGGYYEAILQIRAHGRTFSDEELGVLRSTVENMVGQLQESGKRGLFITDSEEKREGLDFFLSEKGTALSIAKKVQEQFGGEFKSSTSSAGMKDSRQLYRMTYLVRLPSYRKGDIFMHRGSFYGILSLHANKARAIDLSSWEEKVIDGKDITPSKIYGGQELVKEMIVVSQSRHDIQLMDQKSFTMFEIPRPKKATITTQLVKTVKIEGRVFLYPEKPQ
jgi:nonsense-mediated mRNA decay protein 3